MYLETVYNRVGRKLLQQ